MLYSNFFSLKKLVSLMIKNGAVKLMKVKNPLFIKWSLSEISVLDDFISEKYILIENELIKINSKITNER